MVIESRTIVGTAAAFALVGAALWVSTLLFEPPSHRDAVAGSVEIVQMPTGSWDVEVRDLGAADIPVATARTAANR